MYHLGPYIWTRSRARLSPGRAMRAPKSASRACRAERGLWSRRRDARATTKVGLRRPPRAGQSVASPRLIWVASARMLRCVIRGTVGGTLATRYQRRLRAVRGRSFRPSRAREHARQWNDCEAEVLEELGQKLLPLTRAGGGVPGVVPRRRPPARVRPAAVSPAAVKDPSTWSVGSAGSSGSRSYRSRSPPRASSSTHS